MDVVSVEVISLEEATNLRRHARRKRREERERLEKMTMGDVRKLLEGDISTFRARAALATSGPVAPTSLFVPKGNKYEATEAIAQLLFAQASQEKALLVEFSWSPSKAFEDRFRQAAKKCQLTMHFYRLTGGWVVFTFQSKETLDESDTHFLKRAGICW